MRDGRCARQRAPSRAQLGFCTVACLLALGLHANAYADEPCTNLPPDEQESYLKIGDKALTAYQDGDYAEAVKHILAAMDICDEDPRTRYNLARAYHRAGNCNMALFWYEQVLELEAEGPYAEAIREQRSKAGRYKTELQVECANSARVRVECTDPGVIVTLGEFATVKCPFTGRVDAGTYKLQATLPGHETYVAQVELVAGESNRLLVPELAALNVNTTSDKGRLRVTCPDEVVDVTLGVGGLRETVRCPVDRELEPGRYEVSFSDEEPATVDVVAGETVALRLRRSGDAPATPNLGLVLGLRFAPGVGLATGELYRDDNRTKFGRSLDGMQPTLLTTAIENEIGWAVSERLVLGVQSRLEVANLALLGLAFLRYTVADAGWLQLRLDVAGGGGRILAPVEVEDGQRPLVRFGPGFGSGGVSTAFAVSRYLAIVLGVETRVGFPDLGVLFDCGLGLEVRL